MLVKESAKTSQSFRDGQFFGEDKASMCTLGFLPLLNERKKVLTVEGHQGSAFGCGQRQLLNIGPSEIAGLLRGQTIYSVRRQCGAEDNRNVFIRI